jgi:hypothetical protein
MIGSFCQLVCFFSTLKLWIVKKLIIISERLDVIERSNKGRINKKSLSTRFLMTKHIEENMQIVVISVLLDYLHYNSKSISASFCFRYTSTISSVEY